MVDTYLGLGSNLGNRVKHICLAARALERLGEITALSPLYETEPWGYAAQGRFINAACALVTELEPLALLDAVKEIEAELGRQKTFRNGPREIDIDILLYGDWVVSDPRLSIPHVGLLGRATALLPLCDIAPAVRHPQTGLTVAQHLEALGAAACLAPFPPGLPQTG